MDAWEGSCDHHHCYCCRPAPGKVAYGVQKRGSQAVVAATAACNPKQTLIRTLCATITRRPEAGSAHATDRIDSNGRPAVHAWQWLAKQALWHACACMQGTPDVSHVWAMASTMITCLGHGVQRQQTSSALHAKQQGSGALIAPVCLHKGIAEKAAYPAEARIRMTACTPKQRSATSLAVLASQQLDAQKVGL